MKAREQQHTRGGWVDYTSAGSSTPEAKEADQLLPSFGDVLRAYGPEPQLVVGNRSTTDRLAVQ